MPKGAKVAGRSKSRGLRVLWIPKSHKKKKNKYYVSHDSESPTRSIMSGDSPNAFTNENVFDFKEGRASPAPTTSKEHKEPNQNSYVTASVLVEPQKGKEKDKDKDKEDEDHPDFSSPTLNPGADKDNSRKSDPDKTLELNEPKHDGSGKDDKKEEQNLLNGGLDRLPKTYTNKEFDEDSEDDTCIVNCIYYTMECCKCSIV